MLLLPTHVGFVHALVTDLTVAGQVKVAFDVCLCYYSWLWLPGMNKKSTKQLLCGCTYSHMKNGFKPVYTLSLALLVKATLYIQLCSIVQPVRIVGRFLL